MSEEDSLVEPKQTIFVELDWRAYFFAFMEKHGSSPVNYAGRLLFRDGWMYSDTAYEGPEWEPLDAKQSKHLQAVYWKIRRQILKEEVFYLSNELTGLERLQLHKSITLQQQLFKHDEDGFHGRTISTDVDYDFLEMQLKLLKEDLETCERRLKEFTDVQSTATVDN
jgi:hypothetical protein